MQQSIRPWHRAEITLTAAHDHPDGYAGVAVWADFVHDSGVSLRRPAFWDGGRTWRIRFASPLAGGRWRWRTAADVADPGLADRTGELAVTGPDPAEAGAPTDPAVTDPTDPAEATEATEATARRDAFRRHGFWRMSRGGRSLVHADGTPALLVGDTAWALPWRATEEQVEVYAADRAAKGFNAALLMSVQPDMGARGPRDRTADQGFDVAFEDLPDGGLDRLNPGYFQHLDRLLAILTAHGIAPVLQPVFQGFGWKGLSTAGTVVTPAAYARYCRYLVARYGADPVVYLVGADGSGREPQVEAGGREIEEWDAYGQPCGIHYRPHVVANAHQDAPWLDFQWCQTGHNGEHVPERVADMWRNEPVRGVANGEPTYEHTNERGRAEGWWQGHEAWSNLCAGGTMGVVYGAGSLWQWVLRPDEPGHAPYFLAPGAGWREALDFEGSRYVGLVSRILAGLPTTDLRPSWTLTTAPRGLLAPGTLYVGYGERGGDLRFAPWAEGVVPPPYRVVDPRTGRITAAGVRTAPTSPIPDPGGAPRIYLCYAGWRDPATPDGPAPG